MDNGAILGAFDLKTGQRLWGSRFGDVTSFRIPFQAGVTKALQYVEMCRPSALFCTPSMLMALEPMPRIVASGLSIHTGSFPGFTRYPAKVTTSPSGFK